MAIIACPNYMTPFNGWVVIDNDEASPKFIKKFVGRNHQLDAQMLTILLNKSVEDL